MSQPGTQPPAGQHTSGPCNCTYHYCLACSTSEAHDLCPLHAAAQDLLEALEAMLLNRELGEYESQRQGKPRMIEVMDAARAAIQKATQHPAATAKRPHP